MIGYHSALWIKTSMTEVKTVNMAKDPEKKRQMEMLGNKMKSEL